MTKPIDAEREWISLPQAAALLQTSEWKMRRLVERRRIASRQLLGARREVRRADVLEYAVTVVRDADPSAHEFAAGTAQG